MVSIAPLAEATALRELPATAVRDVLTRMTELPSLRDRYQPLLDANTRSLRDLPVLTKDDFRSAFPDTLHRALRREHGALVLGSGGTTSEPKLSLMPSDQFINDIRDYWDPLTVEDVLVNYDTPGRLCSSHNFFNALAHASGAVAIPLGAVDDDQLPEWLDFMERLGATALNATQSHIAHILETCETLGRRPPAFRKVLWTGEAFGERAQAITRQMLPDAQLYGVYGSTETWVIGHNGPSCALDTFHVMPYQHVELSDGLVLVTNLHPKCINPVVRYRIGDRGEFVSCPCGRTEPALRVLRRDDAQFKFLSILVAPQEIADVTRAQAGVTDVQIGLFDHGAPGERMELRLKVTPGTEHNEAARRVRQAVLTKVYRLGYEVESEPHAFAVRVCRKFAINQRSGKTPLLVEDQPVEDIP